MTQFHGHTKLANVLSSLGFEEERELRLNDQRTYFAYGKHVSMLVGVGDESVFIRITYWVPRCPGYEPDAWSIFLIGAVPLDVIRGTVAVAVEATK